IAGDTAVQAFAREQATRRSLAEVRAISKDVEQNLPVMQRTRDGMRAKLGEVRRRWEERSTRMMPGSVPGPGPRRKPPKAKGPRIIPTNDIDVRAEALAKRIGGAANVRLEGYGDRVWDAVSDRFVAQTT